MDSSKDLQDAGVRVSVFLSVLACARMAVRVHFCMFVCVCILFLVLIVVAFMVL